MKKKMPLIHPGEILFEEFLKPLAISQYRLATDIHVSARRVNEIVHGTRAVSANTALRLAKALNTTPAFWMNMQARYDLEVAEDSLADVIKKIEPINAQAA